MIDVIVIGAGPAGVLAAFRAADLGARTALVTRDEFGGMAANDGPVPVRTLAHAARLIREARQLGQYGIGVSEPVLDYPRLLARVREVVDDVRAAIPRCASRSIRWACRARTSRRCAFRRPSTPSKPRAGCGFEAEKFIICTGGVSRRLDVPGFELTNTHSDAWGLTSVPPSMLVDWRRRNRGAGGLDLQRIWLASRNSSIGPAHSADARMKMFRQPSRPLSAARASRFTKISARSSRSRKRRPACG